MELSSLNKPPRFALFDFIGVRHKTSDGTIIARRAGERGYDPSALSGTHLPPPRRSFIVVKTPDGDVHVSVPHTQFGTFAIGKPVRVRYRRGRRSGFLKGKIVS